jgi:hypothetical protein
METTMIKVENDMLVLDNTFTKEDVKAIDEFVKINVDKKINGIIELIEEMPWMIYQGVAHDGTILNLPTPKVLDREAVIALIKGESK